MNDVEPQDTQSTRDSESKLQQWWNARPKWVRVSFNQSCFRARSVANQFIEHVHAGRLAQARTLAAVEMQPYLAPDPPRRVRDSDRFHTLEMIRHATTAAFSGYVGSIDGGCLTGELRGQGTFWIVVRWHGRFEVVDLGSRVANAECDLTD
jgi:hypothetical protein